MNTVVPKTILIDRRTYDTYKDQILKEVSEVSLVGLDLETQDVNAHEGLKLLRKEDQEGNRSGKGKSVMDWRRMVITGLSIYPDGSDHAYYINLAHADVSNRLTWEEVKPFLDAKGEDSSFVCHGAVFERTVLANAVGYELPDNTICTLQMAVSAYGPDEYNKDDYANIHLGDITALFPDVMTLFAKNAPVDIDDSEGDEDGKGRGLSPKQQDLLSKVISKSSHASYSYNGVIDTISYGYGLKKAIKSHFGHQMTTFEETLGEENHMGMLTGEQVAEYGAEDAFWAVKLFYKLYQYMKENCPNAIPTFFSQENPMVRVYSDIRRDGFKVNMAAIENKRDEERAAFAAVLREMKKAIRDLLPFDDEPNSRLAHYEKWYREKTEHYRSRIEAWALSDDSDDDFTQACQVSSPVSNAWANRKLSGLSINHYYQTRILLYDLCGVPAILYKGKVQSDGETRGEVRDILKKKLAEAKESGDKILQKHYETADKLVELMGKVSSIDQRMKLYITPYGRLTDPETSRMYCEVSSMLASRRMACSNPNAMQLAKRGESTYVRGFYEPDEKDHVLVSIDWSQIELVLIGEFSGDPEFKRAYGQLPYEDMHLGAAADVLSVVIPEVNEKMLKELSKMNVSDIPPKLLIKPNGEPLDPEAAKKYWRTEAGKGSNFNYWYSGALSTVGDKLGLTSKQMWDATERYRERFAVAEKWRVDLIEQARWSGFVELPDGHRRYRHEATYEWQNLTDRMFKAYQNDAIYSFGREVIRALRTRAGNQIVNSMIQGSCATLAKRSILAVNKRIIEDGYAARFKIPVHDELVWSVHKSEAVDFIHTAKGVMRNHPEIISNLKIDATASIGLTFEPFHEKKAPIGQIEIDEAPELFGFGAGVKLDDDQANEVIKYLFNKRAELNA